MKKLNFKKNKLLKSAVSASSLIALVPGVASISAVSNTKSSLSSVTCYSSSGEPAIIKSNLSYCQTKYGKKKWEHNNSTLNTINKLNNDNSSEFDWKKTTVKQESSSQFALKFKQNIASDNTCRTIAHQFCLDVTMPAKSSAYVDIDLSLKSNFFISGHFNETGTGGFGLGLTALTESNEMPESVGDIFNWDDTTHFRKFKHKGWSGHNFSHVFAKSFEKQKIENPFDKEVTKKFYFTVYVFTSTWKDVNGGKHKLDDSILRINTCIGSDDPSVYIPFTDDKWDNVCKYANEGVEALHKHYYWECEHNTQFPGTLIGLEKTVFINDMKHIVKVIDENHDTLADGSNKKAALTFELMTILTDSNGKAIKSYWGNNNNYHFTNSVLRKNLGGNAHPANNYWKKNNVLDMLKAKNANLVANIKSVKKEVCEDCKNPESFYGFGVISYSDKLFPLSFSEMGFNQSKKDGRQFLEGTPYAYWSKNNNNGARIKVDAMGERHTYWLSSPVTDQSNSLWRIKYTGKLYNNNYIIDNSAVGGYWDGSSNSNILEESCVSFAFCI